MMVKEIITEKYIVRIHTGKLTDEERKEVLKNATRQFFQDIQGTDDYPDGIHSVCK